MRAMRPTLLIPAGFQLAVIFLLTIVPVRYTSPESAHITCDLLFTTVYIGEPLATCWKFQMRWES